MSKLSIVDQLDANRDKVIEDFRQGWQDFFSARDLVKKIIELTDDYDPERITEIDHGEYQGTIVFVVGAKGYQPSEYIYTRVYYGSCSGCDELQAIYEIESEERYELLYKFMHDIASNFRLMYDGHDPVA